QIEKCKLQIENQPQISRETYTSVNFNLQFAFFNLQFSILQSSTNLHLRHSRTRCLTLPRSPILPLFAHVADMLFRFEDVHKSYGAQEVLRGITFQINPGEHVGLVGRNGAGKTTLFRLLTGKEEADRGEVVLLRGLRIGLLEQQPTFTA